MLRLCYALISLAAAAHAATITNLGAANDFNLFILGDHTPNGTDNAGRVAVMGNAAYTPFSPAQNNNGNSISSGTTNLVVGGDLNWTYGSMGTGNVWVGGNATITGVGGLNGNVQVNGNLTLQNLTTNGNLTVGGTFQNNGGVGGSYNVANGTISSPIDFAAEKAYLEGASQYWSTLGGTPVRTDDDGGQNWVRFQTLTGTTLYNPWGQFMLTGTDPDLNVFYVPSFLVHPLTNGSLNGMSISVPTGSTVLINSDETNVVLGGYGQSYSGATANTVLFNFYNAVTLNAQNFGGMGSLLAPKAAYTGQGKWDGTAVVKSVAGGTEFHNHIFSGNLPNAPSEVPEPSTFVAVSGGLALAYMLKRRR